MANRTSAVSPSSENPKTAWRKPFCIRSLLRSLTCYTAVSLAEVLLMTLRTSDETQVLIGLASDLLSKLAILLLASFLFGFSYVVFHVRAFPNALRRFLHIVLLFIPIVLVSQSLVTDTNLDMQAYVAYYFVALLLYLLVYGASMLIMSVYRKKRANPS